MVNCICLCRYRLPEKYLTISGGFMNKFRSLVFALMLVLSACSANQQANPSYVIITMPVDTAIPYTTIPLQPTHTPILSTPTFTPTTTFTPTPVVGCVTVSSLAVRSGPGTNWPKTGGLVIGDCITVSAYSADKLWVQYSGGWVSVQYLNFSHLTVAQQLTLAAQSTATPIPTPYQNLTLFPGENAQPTQGGFKPPKK